MSEIPGETGKYLETERERLLLDLNAATTILLSDRPSRPVDAVFFFSRSYFDAEKRGIFQVAVDLIKKGKAGNILLADSEGERVGETIPQVANPGKSLLTDRLVKLGVERDHIVHCPHPTPGERGFHTKTEAEAFLQTSISRGMKTAVVLTQPHQIVRAVLSVIQGINQKSVSFDVWSMAPVITDWNKKVMGSQGMERKPRMDHIQDEIERIFKYQAKGDIASFDALFAYLVWRNNRQLI